MRRSLMLVGVLVLLLAVPLAMWWRADIAGSQDPALPPHATNPSRQPTLTDDAALEKWIAEFVPADDYAVAAGLAKELHARRVKALGEDHWQTVNAMFLVQRLQKLSALSAEKQWSWLAAVGEKQAATALEAKGQHADALAARMTYSDRCREVLGDRHPDTASAYTKAAENLHAQAKYAEAASLFHVALDIRRKALGEGHPETAQGYSNLALNLRAQGKYVEAGPLAQSALDIWREVLGDSHPATAHGYSNLAGNLGAQGRHADAQPLYEKALAIWLTANEGDRLTLATGYNNLAANLADQAKHAEAQELFEKALSIRRQVLGENHLSTATSYNNLAYNLSKRGEYAAAHALYKQALDIRGNSLGEGHPDTASGYNNVAYSLFAQGKHAEAGPLFVKALETYRKALGEAHPDTARIHNHIATNLVAQRKFADARDRLTKAVFSAEAARLTAAAGLDRSGLNRPEPRLLLAAVLAADNPADAWAEVELSLARGLLDQQSGNALDRLTFWERIEVSAGRARLAALEPAILKLATLPKPTEAEGEDLAKLLAERGKLEVRLAALAVLDSERAVAPSAQIQDALPKDGALVGWVDVVSPSGGVQEHWGYVVRRDGNPCWERLPGTGPDGAWTKDDGEMPGKLRAALAGTATTAEVKVLAERLHAQRLAPLAKHLDGVTELSVVAVHAMAGVPVEVLAPNSTIGYTPSGTYLARTKEPAKPTGQKLLVLGDPKYPPVPQVRLGGVPDPKPTPEVAARRSMTEHLANLSRGGDWAELPGTAVEVNSLQALFVNATTTTLTRSDASPERLEQLRTDGRLAEFRYLHFAAHGEANNARAFESALILSGSDTTVSRLTARTVLDTWKLNADLVTLSACETASGKPGGGDGLLGFAQAFLTAGSRAVCLSLWKVDDAATALLMDRFYQNLLGKRVGLAKPLGKAAALAEAKQWLWTLTADEAGRRLAALTKGVDRGKDAKPLELVVPKPVAPKVAAAPEPPFAHPRYWAAFVLVGDRD